MVGIFVTLLITESHNWRHWPIDDISICLVDPISRTVVYLPSTSGLVNQKQKQMLIGKPPPMLFLEFKFHIDIRKCIISTSPMDQDCAILIIYDEGKLAFCRPRDYCWTKVDSAKGSFCSLMFCKGQFYVINKRNKVVCCKVGANAKVELILAQVEPSDVWKNYLTESLSGELMFVSGCLERDQSGCLKSDQNSALFEVYKLDMRTKKWSEVKNLGDQALFFSCDGSNQYLQLILEDCIYLTGYNHKLVHVLKYDLKTKQIQWLHQSELMKNKQTQWLHKPEVLSPKFHWIKPNV